jgi:hypothetical protein
MIDVPHFRRKSQGDRSFSGAPTAHAFSAINISIDIYRYPSPQLQTWKMFLSQLIHQKDYPETA